jgi:hypothetical protein
MVRALGIIDRCFAADLINKAGFSCKTAQTGAASLIQRFGRALNLNIRFLMVFLDGTYVEYPDVGVAIPQFSPEKGKLGSLFRSATLPTILCHQGPARAPRTSVDHDHQISGARWNQGLLRRQPVDEAAARRYKSLPVTITQSLCIGSVPVRVLVAVSRPTSPSSGF